jgi:hypothetical protein
MDHSVELAIRPEPVETAQPADRLISAGAEDTLKRFSEPALLAAGKVNLISLEAVEKRFASRWELRRNQVYDFATRVLDRGVGVTGFFVRISSTDFFIVHPDLGRLAGQAACLRYLREVLNHFLGEDQMAAAGVLQVTKITKGRLEAQRMDERAQDVDAATRTDLEVVLAPPAAAPPGSERSPDRWSPFVASDGRHLRVSAKLEPVYELKGFARIGFRMIRRVLIGGSEEELTPQQLAKLSTADLLRIDLATAVRGLDRLHGDSAGERQLSLIVPVSFISLSSQKGRGEFIEQLKAAGGLVKLGVICEVCDIDGVPPGALLAATSLLRPFTLLIVGRLLNTAPTAIVRLEGSGLQALSFECPPGLGEAEFVGWATAAIGASKRVAKSVLVYGAKSAQQAGTLASLGASHVSLAGA